MRFNGTFCWAGFLRKGKFRVEPHYPQTIRAIASCCWHLAIRNEERFRLFTNYFGFVCFSLLSMANEIKPGRVDGVVQFGGVGSRWRQRSVGTTNVPSTAHSESCSLPAGIAISARCHAAHDGQRRHILRSTRSLYLHLQVIYPSC